MSQEEIIAGRYARGLAERAAETDALDAVRSGLKALSDAMNPKAGGLYVPELVSFLSSPAVDAADKLKVADGFLSKGGIHEVVADFFLLLVKKGRVGLLPRIHRAFTEISGPMTGECAALVETAQPLTRDQESRLAQALSGVFGGVVRIHQQVEPALLAGARVRVCGKTIDGSVLGKLERMRETLAAGVRRGMRDDPSESS